MSSPKGKVRSYDACKEYKDLDLKAKEEFLLEAMKYSIDKKDKQMSCELCLDSSFNGKSAFVRHFWKYHKTRSHYYNDVLVYVCNKGCQKGAHYHCPCGCQKMLKRAMFLTHIRVVPSQDSSFGGNGPVATYSAEGLQSVSTSCDVPIMTSPLGVTDTPLVQSSDMKIPHLDVENCQRFSSTASPTVGHSVDYPDSISSGTGQLPSLNSTVGLPIELESTAELLCGVDLTSSSVIVEADLPKENKPEHVKCDQCGMILKYRRNLKTHIQRAHSSKERKVIHNGVCIDRNNGVYLVSETRSGVQYPIHVQKLIRGNTIPRILCESKKCLADKVIDGVSGNPTSECSHLQSVNHYPDVPEVDLDLDILNDMVEEGRLEQETVASLRLKKRTADAEGVALVNAMTPALCSERFIFLSVCAFGMRCPTLIDRFTLTFDRKDFDLFCQCKSRVCEHRSIAKWYLRSQFPQLFTDEKNGRITTMSLNMQYSSQVEHEFNNWKVCTNIKTPKEDFSERMIVAPSETVCPQGNCSGSLDLHEKFEKAKLFTRSGCVTIFKVWNKICRLCSTVVSYSGIDEGVFNFNNRFFVSATLVLWLRISIREHVALSKTINTIEKLYEVNVDHNLVRRTFYKFLALLDDEKNFNCILCGFHPVILTFDVSRKVTFKSHQFEDDGDHSDMVNAKDFRQNLSKCVISPEFDRSIRPSIDNWAPFVPVSSRRGDMLFNSEAFKCARNESDDQEFLKCLSEERFESILENTNLNGLQELCVECGIRAPNSKQDCIRELYRAIQNHTDIDKFFYKNYSMNHNRLLKKLLEADRALAELRTEVPFC